MAENDSTAGGSPDKSADTLNEISLEAERALILLAMADEWWNGGRSPGGIGIDDVWIYHTAALRKHLERIEALAEGAL